MHRRFAPSSTNRLTYRNLDRFPGVTLFDRIAQAVCRAGCLPRKELYEAWETARRVRRLFRGGGDVDLAGGDRVLPPPILVLAQTAPAAGAGRTRVPPPASTPPPWPPANGAR